MFLIRAQTRPISTKLILIRFFNSWYLMLSHNLISDHYLNILAHGVLGFWGFGAFHIVTTAATLQGRRYREVERGAMRSPLSIFRQ